MCGRFTLHTPSNEIVKRFLLPQLPFGFNPSYNIAPTQTVLTVLASSGVRTPSLMRWGLPAPWAKGTSSGPPLINARLETLTEKRTFQRLVNSNRCLIVADGFYEWRKEGGTKQPIYITLDSGQLFAFAGLWQNEPTPSCTIITQAASSLIKPIHHRMPLILTPESEELWLAPTPFVELRNRLPDQEQRRFGHHQVSTFVNSSKNNEASCISAIE